jgi:1-deoxy-D-xylulose-5-phosphate synthase
MSPVDENELQHMVKTMVDYDEGPIALRFPRGNGLGVKMDAELRALEIGKGEVVLEGKDVVFLAIGDMVNMSLKAAKILASRGVSASVVNARFVKPLDTGLIDTMLKSEPVLLTVEENAIAGGFGSGVNEYLISRGYDTHRVRNFGLPDHFVEHGDRDKLLGESGLSVDALVEAALEGLDQDERLYRPVTG